MAELGGREAGTAVTGQRIRNGGLIGFGGSGREGERDLAEAQLEQAIAALGLAVVVPLWGCPGQDLDLAIVEPESRSTIIVSVLSAPRRRPGVRDCDGKARPSLV